METLELERLLRGTSKSIRLLRSAPTFTTSANRLYVRLDRALLALGSIIIAGALISYVYLLQTRPTPNKTTTSTPATAALAELTPPTQITRVGAREPVPLSTDNQPDVNKVVTAPNTTESEALSTVPDINEPQSQQAAAQPLVPSISVPKTEAPQIEPSRYYPPGAPRPAQVTVAAIEITENHLLASTISRQYGLPVLDLVKMIEAAREAERLTATRFTRTLAIAAMANQFSMDNQKPYVGMMRVNVSKYPKEVKLIRAEGYEPDSVKGNIMLGAQLLSKFTAETLGDDEMSLQIYANAKGDKTRAFAKAVLETQARYEKLIGH